MLDHDEGRSPALDHPGDGVAHLLNAVGIEVGGRFVKDDEARPHGNDRGERQALLLPARERAGGVIQRNVESDQVEGLTDPRPDLLAGNAKVFAPEGDLISHAGEHHLRVGVLQNEARTTACRARRRTVQADRSFALALVTAEHTGYSANERGLARPRRSEQQDALAGIDPQVDAAQRPRTPTAVAPPPAVEVNGDG